jgi:hypothetical protein
LFPFVDIAIFVCALLHLLLGPITRMARMGDDLGARFVTTANMMQGLVAGAGAAAVA